MPFSCTIKQIAKVSKSHDPMGLDFASEKRTWWPSFRMKTSNMGRNLGISLPFLSYVMFFFLLWMSSFSMRACYVSILVRQWHEYCLYSSMNTCLWTLQIDATKDVLIEIKCEETRSYWKARVEAHPNCQFDNLKCAKGGSDCLILITLIKYQHKVKLDAIF
jgi:hypothetical protein